MIRCSSQIAQNISQLVLGFYLRCFLLTMPDSAEEEARKNHLSAFPPPAYGTGKVLLGLQAR